MVKADIKRNYYGDLELPSDASLEDIKKQYRKLALKYHPDRNPGKEAEIVSKFQAIQFAHEVLEDPATKAKYDADRKRAGLVPNFGGRTAPATSTPRAPPPNPYTAGASAYPPPPRRTPTSAGPGGWRPTAAPGGTTGADRFTSFPKPAPTSKKDSDKANVFTAWQNMNHGKREASARQQQQQQQQQQHAPPPNPRAQAKGSFANSTSRPAYPPRPDTSYPSPEDIRAGTNYRQAPAGGFTSERQRTAWAEFNASNAGKPGVSRSNTTKTPKKSGFDPLSGGDEGQAGSTANYSSSRARTRSDDTRSYPPPPRFGESSMPPGEYDVPYTEHNRAKTPYSSHIGQQRYTSTDNLRRSNGAKDASRNYPEQRTTPPLQKQNAPYGTTRRPIVVEDSTDDSESDEGSSATTPEDAQPNTKTNPDLSENPFLRPKRTPIPPSSRNPSPFKQPSVDSTASSGFSGSNKADVGDRGTPNGAQQQQQQQQPSGQGKNTIFTFPVNNDMFSSTKAENVKSASAENISTKFTPTQWTGTFTANNVFAAPVPTAKKDSSPVRKSSRILRSKTSGLQQAQSTAGDGPFSQYAATTSESSPHEQPSPPRQPVKFDADEWAKTMADPMWAFQPEALRSDPSLTASRPTSRGGRKTSAKPVGVKIPATVPKPATATAVEDETAPAQSSASEDMMDIDMEGVPPGKGNYAPQKEPRFVKVDPPSFRQGGKAEKSGPTLKTKLDDLASVLNQPTTGEGLTNLADISSTLPFQSKPSAILPTKSYTPQQLSLPKLPVPPEQPTKLSKQTWHSYCEGFARYLSKYHDYNSAMVMHFSTRNDNATEMVTRGVSELESIGAEKWLGYKQSVEEDERVRLHWGIGCEKHIEAVRSFEGVRERVRVLSEGAGLSDV